MKLQLSSHFTFKNLLLFAFPSIIMMIFTSIYGVVDGYFVSNFVGKTPFAAVNYIMPVLMILGSFGFMFGTGGSAYISRKMGENDKDKANKSFSLFVYVAIILGVILAVVGFFTMRPLAQLLGASENMLEDCVLYGRVIIIALPAFILQYAFQSFLVAAEKPKLGLLITVFAGVTNIVCDALFVAVFKWGLTGAAAATALSQVVGGVVPLIYFLCPNKSLLRLGKTDFDFKALFKACTNGSSELLSNISMSIVGMLYNMQLMRYIGENGVAAYGVLMYVNYFFLAIFIGFSVGTAPLISYNLGAGNHAELKSIFKKSLIFIAATSICMLILGECLAAPLSGLFVGYDAELLELTKRGFLICSFMFLFAGVSIYGSSFFTALNNGLFSALISFLRTLIFQLAAIFIMPLLFGVDGIWASIVVAEFLAAVVTAVFLVMNRKKYQY